MDSLLHVPHPDAEYTCAALCTQQLAQQITGRSRRTVQRWISRRRITDRAALRLLQTVLHGLLPAPWQDWKIKGDALFDGTGQRWRLTDLRAAGINAQLVSAQRQRIRELERRISVLEGDIAARPMDRLMRAATALRGKI